MHLPKGHKLELIDICESLRNKSSVTIYHKQLQEVNSIQPIPREYILGFHPQIGQFIKNPNYNVPKELSNSILRKNVA